MKSLFYVKTLLCLAMLSGCMSMEGESPSRVAITNADGAAQPEEISLLSGMTHRFYSGVYVNELEGERFVPDASKQDFLSDQQFDLVDGNAQDSVLSILPNGCLRAKSVGDKIVRFSGFSLKRGSLESTVKVHVKAAAPQLIVSKSAQSFSVTQMKDSRGINFGLTINDRFFMMPSAVTNVQAVSALDDSKGVVFDNDGAVSASPHFPQIWSDMYGGGFFVGYGQSVSGKDRLSYSMLDNKGQKIPGLFLSDVDLDIKKVYGGQLRNTIPVAIALSQKKDSTGQPANLGLFMFLTDLSQKMQRAYLTDGGADIEIPKSVLSDRLDRVIQFGQDRTGTLNIMMGTFMNHPDPQDPKVVVPVNQLKFVMFNEASGMVVETPQGMTLDSPSAFALDTTLNNPRLIFVRNKQLLFTQRIGGWVLSLRVMNDISQDSTNTVDGTFSPRLSANREDGTMAAAWKSTKGEIHMRISRDGGGKWMSDVALSGVSATDIELIPLPCGGTALLTQESNGVYLRFIDDIGTQFSAPIQLITGSSSVLSSFKIFRNDQTLTFFYLDSNGVHMMRTP